MALEGVPTPQKNTKKVYLFPANIWLGIAAGRAALQQGRLARRNARIFRLDAEIVPKRCKGKTFDFFETFCMKILTF